MEFGSHFEGLSRLHGQTNRIITTGPFPTSISSQYLFRRRKIPSFHPIPGLRATT